MRVMITGSFDPPTLGHLDIIKRASALFDEVVVCVAENSEKKYAYSADRRLEMLAAACGALDNVTVDLCHGLVAEYAASHGIDAIVKGVRSPIDLDYEMTLDRVNKSIAGVETLFLAASPEYSHLSSTVAREMIKYGRDLSGILPPEVIDLL